MMQSEKEQAPGARNEGECPQDAPSVASGAGVVKPVVHAGWRMSRCWRDGGGLTWWKDRVTCPACLEAMGR